jgi:hypothetical protein
MSSAVASPELLLATSYTLPILQFNFFGSLPNLEINSQVVLIFPAEMLWETPSSGPGNFTPRRHGEWTKSIRCPEEERMPGTLHVFKLTRNGWGATIIDGMSTLFVAGLRTEFSAAVNHSLSVDFNSAVGLVDPFETIIRYTFGILFWYSYVGSLVSSADLMEFDGSFPPQTIAGVHQQAERLANKLAPGFDREYQS